jgi:hypothetical protein
MTDRTYSTDIREPINKKPRTMPGPLIFIKNNER